MLSADDRTRSCATELVCRDCGYRTPLLDTAFKCPAAARASTSTTTTSCAKARLAERPPRGAPAATSGASRSCCRSSTPGPGAGRPATAGQHAADPRRPARRRARPAATSTSRTTRPTARRLSYKDRVVSMAVARLLELGKDEIGCVSTGNVGTAVASLAAKAGVAAYVFYPGNMEKRQGAGLPGARRRRYASSTATTTRPTAPAASWRWPAGCEFANITLRPFYAEGAKTMAFEVVEQLELERAGPHRHPGRRRHALLARPQGPRTSWRRSAWPRPPATKINIAQAERLQPDRDRDPRRRRRDRAADAARPRRTRSRSARRATAPW